MKEDKYKNVLHLISSTGFFGAENVIIQLVRRSDRYGIKPYIGVFRNSLNPHTEIATIAKKENMNVTIFDCQGRLDLRLVFKIRKFIKINRIDVFHSHGYKSNMYGLLACLGLNKFKISTCHNWIDNNNKIKFYNFIDKIILRKFNNVIAVSEKVKDELIKRGIPPNKLHIINNGIDINDSRWNDKTYNKELKKEFSITNDEKIIGTIGRLSKEKGHIFLLEAAKEICKKYPNVKFMIIGDGILKEDLLEQTKIIDIEDKIIFAGTRNDISNLLQVMDIFILPSLIEGLPMALLEAMASKRPIIASKVGAIPIVIKHNYSGILIEPGNVVEIIKAIERLLKDTKTAQLYAYNAYEVAKKEYSSDKMMQGYYDIYTLS